MLTLDAAARTAVAQSGAAPALYLDPSVRAAGMGGAATGVSWGGAPDAWANPALRAFHAAGLGYSATGSPVRDAEDGITALHSHNWTIASSGIGIGIAGRPVDLGGSHIDSDAALSADGSRETVASSGFGVSVAGVMNAWPSTDGAPRQFGRVADVDFGMSWKRDALEVGPGEHATVVGDVAARDRGILLRVTPYNSVDGERPRTRLESRLGGARMDVTFGGADLNYTRAAMTFGDGRAARPVSRADRYGWSLFVTAGYVEPRAESRTSRVLAHLSPLLSFGSAWDHATWSTQALTADAAFTSTVVEHSGWELTLANILSLRGGRIIDHGLGSEAATRGATVAVPVSRYGGVRWDHAATPTLLPGATGRIVHRNAVTVWVAPRALLRRVRST